MLAVSQRHLPGDVVGDELGADKAGGRDIVS
jgi:hypothetical protein